MINPKCPCRSSFLFAECCEPFLINTKTAATALQLMRSRYTAYTLANIDYIQTTMQGRAAENFDAAEAAIWAQQVTWCGLNIIDAGLQKTDIENDEVEFVAKYVSGNLLHLLHERSQFKKIDGKWFYTSGTLTPHKPTSIKSTDPCPCGSRKKLANCCQIIPAAD